MTEPDERGWHAYPMTDSGTHGWELHLDGQLRAVCIAPGKETAAAIMDALGGEMHYELVENGW